MKKFRSEKVKKRVDIRSTFSPFHLFTFSLLLLLFVVLPVAAFAASLSEYSGKVNRAAVLAGELRNIEQQKYTPAAERARRERETIAALRTALPVSEKVEWQGASIETNNKWLQEQLDFYEKETDKVKRAAIADGIFERLWSISVKVRELENPAASDRTKDEDKQKLGEILNREEYQKPKKEEKSWFARLIEKIIEWFRNNAPEDPQIAPTGGFQTLARVLQILLYTAVIGLVAFLIWRFAPFVAARFGKRERKGKKERVILGERIAEDESSENLFSEAERLARDGNLRGAIRKGYIALLCELSDRKIIGLSRHKTNRDYLRDVRKRRELFENMSGLTLNFERHWYGFDEAETEDWEEFRSGYRKAIAVGK